MTLRYAPRAKGAVNASSNYASFVGPASNEPAQSSFTLALVAAANGRSLIADEAPSCSTKHVRTSHLISAPRSISTWGLLRQAFAELRKLLAWWYSASGNRKMPRLPDAAISLHV